MSIFQWGGYIKKVKLGLVLLSFGLITGLLFAFYNKSFSAEVFNENESNQIYFEKVEKKINDQNFTEEILRALKEKGYNPEEFVGYTITSPDNQVISIYFNELNKEDKEMEKGIQEIINAVSTSNGLNSFVVDIQKIVGD